MHDADHPHVLWNIGIVEKLISGQDRVTREAAVRLSSGRGLVTLRRPLQLLYPLEMSIQGKTPNAATDGEAAQSVEIGDSSVEQKIKKRRGQPRQASSLPEKKLEFA